MSIHAKAILLSVLSLLGFELWIVDAEILRSPWRLLALLAWLVSAVWWCSEMSAMRKPRYVKTRISFRKVDDCECRMFSPLLPLLRPGPV